MSRRKPKRALAERAGRRRAGQLLKGFRSQVFKDKRPRKSKLRPQEDLGW